MKNGIQAVLPLVCLVLGCSSTGSGGVGASGGYSGFGASGATGGQAGTPGGGASFGGASGGDTSTGGNAAAGSAGYSSGGGAGDATGGASGCGAGQMLCPKGCADLESDGENCGSCGYSCTTVLGGKGYCNAGKCECSANTNTDPDNCGSCGNECSVPSVPNAVPICDQGSCSWACAAGTSECSGSCIDTSNDPQNCGACGTKCYAWGTPTCSSSTCVPGTDPHPTWRQQCADELNQLLAPETLTLDKTKAPCLDAKIAGGTPTLEPGCLPTAGSVYCKASTTFSSVATNCLPAIAGMYQGGAKAKTLSCGFWVDPQGAITVMVDFYK